MRGEDDWSDDDGCGGKEKAKKIICRFVRLLCWVNGSYCRKIFNSITLVWLVCALNDFPETFAFCVSVCESRSLQITFGGTGASLWTLIAQVYDNLDDKSAIKRRQCDIRLVMSLFILRVYSVTGPFGDFQHISMHQKSVQHFARLYVNDSHLRPVHDDELWITRGLVISILCGAQ